MIHFFFFLFSVCIDFWKLVACYGSILEYLATKMDLESFLRLLPDQGNLTFFLPYIQACMQKNQAEELASGIRMDAQKQEEK